MIISFVIVEYFSIEEVSICIKNIQSTLGNYEKKEIIISSNSCYSLDIQKKILSEYPAIQWVFNSKNGGFAYAMNRGLEVAVGEILIIMNPDVRLKFGIEKMIHYSYSHNEIGIIAPQIINVEGKTQDSFRSFITPIRFIKRQLNRWLIGEKNIDNINTPKNVDWVIGAFMMIPRKAYDTVGELDEHYFLYCEDMDICTRMYQKGFEVIYYPNAVVEYEGTRSARKSLKYAWIFFNSLFHYWKKFGFIVTRR